MWQWFIRSIALERAMPVHQALLHALHGRQTLFASSPPSTV
jgi:hypothetical protein